MTSRTARRYSVSSQDHVTNDSVTENNNQQSFASNEGHSGSLRRGTSPHNTLGGSMETRTTQVMIEDSEHHSSTDWSRKVRAQDATADPPPLVLDQQATDPDDKLDPDRSNESIFGAIVKATAAEVSVALLTVAVIVFTLGVVTAAPAVEFDGRHAPLCTRAQLNKLVRFAVGAGDVDSQTGVFWAHTDSMDFNAPRCSFIRRAATNASTASCWAVAGEATTNATCRSLPWSETLVDNSDDDAAFSQLQQQLELSRYALYSATLRSATDNTACVSYADEATNIAVWISIGTAVIIATALALILPRRTARTVEWLIDDLVDKSYEEINTVCAIVELTVHEFDLLTGDGSNNHARSGNTSSDQAESGSPTASYNGSRRASRAYRSASVISRERNLAHGGAPDEDESCTAETANFNAALLSMRGLNQRFSVALNQFAQMAGRDFSFSPLSKSPRSRNKHSSQEGSSSPRRRTIVTSDGDNFSDSQSSVEVISPPNARGAFGPTVTSFALRRQSVNFSPRQSSNKLSSGSLGRIVDNADAVVRSRSNSLNHPFAVPASPTNGVREQSGSPQIAIVQSDSDSEHSGYTPPADLGGTLQPVGFGDEGEDSLLNTVASVENTAWHRGFAVFAPILDSVTHESIRPAAGKTPGNNHMFLSVDHIFGMSQADPTLGGAAGSSLSSPANSAIEVAKRRVSRVSEMLFNVNRSRRGSRMPAADEGSESPSLGLMGGYDEVAMQRLNSAVKIPPPANSPHSNNSNSVPMSPWNEALAVKRLADVVTFDLRKRQGTFLHFGIDDLFNEESGMVDNSDFLEKRREADESLGHISKSVLHAREYISQLCLAVAIASIKTFEGVITQVTASSVTSSWNTVRPYPFSDTRATLCAQYLASAMEDLFVHLETSHSSGVIEHNNSSSVFGASNDTNDVADNASAAFGRFTKVGSMASMSSPKALRRFGSMQPAVKAAIERAVIPHKISPVLQRLVAAGFRDKWAISLSHGPTFVGVSGTLSSMNTSQVSDALSGLTRLWRLAIHIKAKVLFGDSLVAGARTHSFVVPVDVISTHANDVRMVFEMRQPLEQGAMLREHYTNFTLAVTQFAAGNFYLAVQMLSEYIHNAPNGSQDLQARRLLAAAKFFLEAAEQRDSGDDKEPGRMASFPRLSSLLRQHSSRMSGMISARRRDARGYLRILPGWMSHEAETEWFLQQTGSVTGVDSVPSTPLLTTRTNPNARGETPPGEALSSRLRDQIQTRHYRSNSRESNVALQIPPSSVATSSDDDVPSEDGWLTGSTRSAVQPSGASYVDDQNRVWRCSERVLGEGSFGRVYLGMAPQGELVAIKVVPIPADVAGGSADDPQMSLASLGLSQSERHGSSWRSGSFHKSASEADTGSSSQEKKVSVAAIDALIAEIGTMSSIRHANIVSYHSTIVTPTSLVIVTEYVPGGSLSQLLQRFGPLPVPAIQSFLKSILSGLAVLHRRGTVHCDVSTNNILVGNDGACKLADFGCSWRIGSLTKAAVSGTPAFMAPEACSGNPCKASDVWGVGVVAMYLATGQLPYQASLVETPEVIVHRLAELNVADLTPNALFRAVELPAAHCRMMNDPNSLICRANPLFKSTSSTALHFTEIAGTDVNQKVTDEDFGKLLVLSFARSCLMLDNTSRPTVDQLNSHGLFLHC